MIRLRSAFTLVEVLLVLAVLLLLAALIFAALGPSRESARQRVCASNLHQLGVAFNMYQQDYDGKEAVVGQPAQYWELGLPTASMAPAFLAAYVKDKQVVKCPDYHGRVAADRMLTTYAWGPSADIPGHDFYSFSNVIAKRGGEFPILQCEEHNPPLDPAVEPRWTTKTVIVLRLNQTVQTKIVPLRSVFDTW